MAEKKAAAKQAAPKEEEPKQAQAEEQSQDKLVVGNVTHHLDRRDSGTNWKESDKLPSLSDPGQS